MDEDKNASAFGFLCFVQAAILNDFDLSLISLLLQALGSFMVFTTLTSEERRDSFAYKGSPKLAPTPIPVSSSATYGVVKHALNL